MEKSAKKIYQDLIKAIETDDKYKIYSLESELFTKMVLSCKNSEEHAEIKKYYDAAMKLKQEKENSQMRKKMQHDVIGMSLQSLKENADNEVYGDICQKEIEKREKEEKQRQLKKLAEKEKAEKLAIYANNLINYNLIMNILALCSRNEAESLKKFSTQFNNETYEVTINRDGFTITSSNGKSLDISITYKEEDIPVDEKYYETDYETVLHLNFSNKGRSLRFIGYDCNTTNYIDYNKLLKKVCAVNIDNIGLPWSYVEKNKNIMFNLNELQHIYNSFYEAIMEEQSKQKDIEDITKELSRLPSNEVKRLLKSLKGNK